MATFFVVNIWLVGMCVPYDDENLTSSSGTLGSPFVIAIERAGVMWFAHVINGFIFLTVISCGITSAYIATRSLAALADLSIIHPFFGRKDTMGRPYVALAISIVLGGGLCYLNCSNQGAVVYEWFSDLVCFQFCRRNKIQANHCLGGHIDALPVGRYLYFSHPVPKGLEGSRH